MAAQNTIADNTDATKIIAIDPSAISTATTHTWTAPDHAGTVNLVLTGTGDPNGVQTADIGRFYVDTATGFSWQKRSGTGNTGWNPTAAKTGTETLGFPAPVGGYDYSFDTLATQIHVVTMDEDINSIVVTNLDLVGTAILMIEIGTAGKLITSLGAGISLASGALADIGTAAGDKATFHFWWDAKNSESRLSIVAG